MEITFECHEHPYPHWEYIQVDSGNRIRVVPERGGLITEWKIDDKEILYFDKDRFNQKTKSVRGGMPILFPICGELPDDKFFCKGDNFTMKQHGFARNLPWEIHLLKDKQGFNLRLCADSITYSNYPYSFQIDMEVRMILSTLDIKVNIQNTGTDILPFSFGLHPYFNF